MLKDVQMVLPHYVLGVRKYFTCIFSANSNPLFISVTDDGLWRRVQHNSFKRLCQRFLSVSMMHIQRTRDNEIQLNIYKHKLWNYKKSLLYQNSFP